MSNHAILSWRQKAEEAEALFRCPSRPNLSRTPYRNPGARLAEKSIGHIGLRIRTDRTGPNLTPEIGSMWVGEV